MTTIKISVREAGQNGLTTAPGEFRFAPTARHIGTDGGAPVVVLSPTFTAPVISGSVTVELEPNTADWCWVIYEGVSGGITRYVNVPNSPTPLLYTDLVDVDPRSLNPSSILQPAWESFNDTINAELIADPASATAAALNAAYGRRGASSGIAWLGDSITRGLGSSNQGDNTPPIGGLTGPPFYGNSIPTYAMLLSNGALQRVVNAGVSGDTSAGMLSRVHNDVIAYKPSTCVVMAGTNDAANSTPLATYAANIRGIVAALRSAGITPILATIPTINSSVIRAYTNLYNSWLRIHARQQGILLWDAYALTVDPATGNLASTMGNTDGTHPGDTGNALLGQAFANQFAPLVGSAPSPLVGDNTDALNKVANGMFLGTPAAGIAPSWNVYGSVATGCTPSVVTDSLVPGNMQQLANVSATGQTVLYQHLASPTVGNRLAFSGILTKTVNEVAFQAYGNSAGGTADAYIQLLDITQPVTRGRWWAEWVIPANITSIDLKFTVSATCASASMGQMTVYDLTAQTVLTV